MVGMPFEISIGDSVKLDYVMFFTQTGNLSYTCEIPVIFKWILTKFLTVFNDYCYFIICLANSLYIAVLKNRNKRSTEKVNRSRLHDFAEQISGIFSLLLGNMSINV